VIVGFDATTLVGRISGVGYYTKRLLEALTDGAAGDEGVEVVVLSNRPVPVTPRPPRLRIHEGGRFPVRSVWMQLSLPRILRVVRPDVVHFTNYLAPVLSDVPYVVSIHDMTLSLIPQHHTFKKRLLTSTLVPTVARRARLVLAPSEATRRDVVRLLRIPPERTRVIPYAPSPRFAPAAGGPDALEARHRVRPPYFLYVGTLEPRKNMAAALRAFARVAADIPEHRFVLVGQRGWNCEDVFAEASRPTLKDRVTFLDYVPEDDLPLLYTHATALVYPSLYEGFGFPVVEAMACGAPVLTSRSSSLAEIGEGAALLVDPRDETEMAEGLRTLATRAELREDLRRRGRARAAEFSWERTARETMAAYREAAGMS
jgi:glycosyltransferase involved in cell wall biosynthesis